MPALKKYTQPTKVVSVRIPQSVDWKGNDLIFSMKRAFDFMFDRLVQSDPQALHDLAATYPEDYTFIKKVFEVIH